MISGRIVHLDILKIHSSLRTMIVPKQWVLRQAQWSKGLWELLAIVGRLC